MMTQCNKIYNHESGIIHMVFFFHFQASKNEEIELKNKKDRVIVIFIQFIEFHF